MVTITGLMFVINSCFNQDAKLNWSQILNKVKNHAKRGEKSQVLKQKIFTLTLFEYHFRKIIYIVVNNRNSCAFYRNTFLI
jgi:SLT domain-containing protein